MDEASSSLGSAPSPSSSPPTVISTATTTLTSNGLTTANGGPNVVSDDGWRIDRVQTYRTLHFEILISPASERACEIRSALFFWNERRGGNGGDSRISMLSWLIDKVRKCDEVGSVDTDILILRTVSKHGELSFRNGEISSEFEWWTGESWS